MELLKIVLSNCLSAMFFKVTFSYCEHFLDCNCPPFYRHPRSRTPNYKYYGGSWCRARIWCKERRLIYQVVILCGLLFSFLFHCFLSSLLFFILSFLSDQFCDKACKMKLFSCCQCPQSIFLCKQVNHEIVTQNIVFYISGYMHRNFTS